MSATLSRRHTAGFWSSARSFHLPLGRQIDPDGVNGYPIDLRVKAAVPRGLPEEMLGHGALRVGLTQYALGCYERFLAGEGEAWLDSALVTGRHLFTLQSPDGSWLHHAPLAHTFPLPPPWASAITQGQAASLFVRLHQQTGDAEFSERARLALAPMDRPQAAGGLCGELAGAPWPEEYPTVPPSHVLNGAMFAVWGMRDVAVALGDATARQQFERHLDAIARNLHRYDTGSWSLYSLFPHPVRNRASSFYHDLHVNQLAAMQLLCPRPEFEPMRLRWAGYAASRMHSARAFGWKATFRLLVPRNRLFARAAPWTRS